MKNIKLNLLILALVYGLSGCGGSDTPNNNSKTNPQNTDPPTNKTPTKTNVTGTEAYNILKDRFSNLKENKLYRDSKLIKESNLTILSIPKKDTNISILINGYIASINTGKNIVHLYSSNDTNITTLQISKDLSSIIEVSKDKDLKDFDPKSLVVVGERISKTKLVNYTNTLHIFSNTIANVSPNVEDISNCNLKYINSNLLVSQDTTFNSSYNAYDKKDYAYLNTNPITLKGKIEKDKEINVDFLCDVKTENKTYYGLKLGDFKVGYDDRVHGDGGGSSGGGNGGGSPD